MTARTAARRARRRAREPWSADAPALALGAAAALTTMVARVYGRRRAAPYLAGFAATASLQLAFDAAMRRRIGPEPSSPADLLTHGRGLCGALLAGLLASRLRDRAGPAGWAGFAATLSGATLSDWLDGPLARRIGPTRRGAVLDIESDSWLTLWAAATAVAWQRLPPWCLLAPLLHYAHPARALWAGALPDGGGPWWARLTGTAQMLVVLHALAPWTSRPRVPLATVVALCQTGTQLALLAGRDPRR